MRKSNRFYAVIAIDYEYDPENNPYIDDDPGAVAACMVVERAKAFKSIENGFEIKNVHFIEEDR